MKKQSKASGRTSRTPAAGKGSQRSGSQRPHGSRQQSGSSETPHRKPGAGSRKSTGPDRRSEGGRSPFPSPERSSGPHAYKPRQSSSFDGNTAGSGSRNPSEPHKSRKPFGSSELNRSRFPSKDPSSGLPPSKPQKSSSLDGDTPGNSSRNASGPRKSPRPFGKPERESKKPFRAGHSSAYRLRDTRPRQQPADDAAGTAPQAGPGRQFSGPNSGRRSSRGPQADDTRTPKRGTGPFRSKGGSFQEFPLNKYIAHCGICSRRKAVDFIKDGLVKVNGAVVTEPGTKVQPSDQVILNGKPLKVQQELVYLLVNKPKGFITTTKDPRARKTVMELIEDACSERVYPVGRLDRNTSGLLLLTNDGDLAQKLSHPSNNIRKVYQAGLDKPLTKADFEKIVQGIELEDGPIHADVLAYSDSEDRTQIGIEIHSGRNHIVRRIFAALGYEVLTLDRVLYAGLTKKNLPRGKWRFLSEREVIFLKHF